MLSKRAGFLLVDVMVAATVLALMVGAAGGLMSAQTAAMDRAAIRDRVTGCFDRALIELAVTPGLSSGACDGVRWKVEPGDETHAWVGTARGIDDIRIPITPR